MRVLPELTLKGVEALALTVMPGARVTVALVPLTMAPLLLRVMVPVPATVWVPWKMRVEPQPRVPVVIDPPGPKVSPPVMVSEEQLALLSCTGRDVVRLRIVKPEAFVIVPTPAGITKSLVAPGTAAGDQFAAEPNDVPSPAPVQVSVWASVADASVRNTTRAGMIERSGFMGSPEAAVGTVQRGICAVIDDVMGMRCAADHPQPEKN